MMKRLAALLLILIVLPRASFAAKQENDLIRVLITRFGTISELSINFSGAYTCGDISFQRGMTVIIAPGRAKGRLQLRCGGFSLDQKGPLKFVRHQAEGENGLRLQNGLNLYTGDLSVSNENGQLRLILTLPVEEYLLGVLPWEMSSGFPLEALKAQAVAARTYALTKRSSGPDYDVVDNTNDQVYAGISESSSVIREAVRSTEGICVYYKGKLVTCYYTASNGGRIETIEGAWGNSDEPTGYIRAKDDPYDFRNDESVVRRAAVPKQWKDDELPQLYSLLCTAAGKALKKLGYSDAPEDIRLRGIAGVRLEDPEASVPKEAVFDLLLDGVRLNDPSEEEISFITNEAVKAEKDSAATDKRLVSLSNQVSVSLPVFPDLEQALQLSINNRDNELWSVQETKDGFTLEARRFGHGVGLSQRGAQRMAAAYGWDYKQILHFYYNDVTLRRSGLKAVTLPPWTTVEFDATPGPIPTATPRPTLMPVTVKQGSTEVLAVVDGVAKDSSLNLRASPDTGSEIVTRLYYGQTLAVMDASEGWLHVRTDTLEGYVMEKFVTVTKSP